MKDPTVLMTKINENVQIFFIFNSYIHTYIITLNILVQITKKSFKLQRLKYSFIFEDWTMSSPYEKESPKKIVTHSRTKSLNTQTKSFTVTIQVILRNVLTGRQWGLKKKKQIYVWIWFVVIILKITHLIARTMSPHHTFVFFYLMIRLIFYYWWGLGIHCVH